jgi:F0F1-type ATP synthase membrane subunit b/b'
MLATMIPRTHRSLLITALLGLSALVGCTSTGSSEVDATSTKMEKLSISIETLRQQVTGTADSLAKVVETAEVDPKPHLKTYVSNFSGASKTAASSRAQLNRVKEGAVKLFEQWDKKAEAITDKDIREASMDRRKDLSKALESVVLAIEPSLDSLDAFLATAKDVNTYLGQDLTPTGIEAIAPKAKSLTKSAKDIDKQLDKVLATVKEAAPKFATAKAPENAKP